MSITITLLDILIIIMAIVLLKLFIVLISIYWLKKANKLISKSIHSLNKKKKNKKGVDEI